MMYYIQKVLYILHVLTVFCFVLFFCSEQAPEIIEGKGIGERTKLNMQLLA